MMTTKEVVQSLAKLREVRALLAMHVPARPWTTDNEQLIGEAFMKVREVESRLEVVLQSGECL